MSEYRVVIVDDQVGDGEILARVIRHEKLSPEIFTDGRRALEFLQEGFEDIVLVITELKLPTLNGLELMRRVHRDLPELPFIITTAYSTRRDIIQALKQGAVDFFEKPYTVKELSAAIRRLKRRTELERNIRKAYGCLKEKRLRFEIGNQIELVQPLVAGLIEEIRLCCRVAPGQLSGIRMGLHELVVNAIEHGNLELSSELKQRHDYLEYIRRRAREMPYRDRRVIVDLDLLPHTFTCIVRDQGKGFDWRRLPDPGNPDNLFKPHGRGVLMATNYFDEFYYNEAGNQVTVCKHFSQHSELKK